MRTKEVAYEKRESFLDRLSEYGYEIEEISKSPVLYLINNKRVNVQTQNLQKRDADGTRYFWFGVNRNTLNNCDYVVFLTTEGIYGFVFPSSFLLSHFEDMYPSNNNENQPTFHLDWDNLNMGLSDGKVVNVSDYSFDLTDGSEITIPFLAYR